MRASTKSNRFIGIRLTASPARMSPQRDCAPRAPRIEMPLQAVVHRGQQGRHHQIGVNHRVWRPVLEAVGAREARRTAQEILQTPVDGERCPQTSVVQPAVSSHRAGDSIACLLEDAAQGVAPKDLEGPPGLHAASRSSLRPPLWCGRTRRPCRAAARAHDKRHHFGRAPRPERRWQPLAERAHVGLRHEAGDEIVLARHLRADLPVVERRSAVFTASSNMKFDSSLAAGASSWSPWTMSRPMAIAYS